MGAKVGRQQARKRERELLEGIGDFEVLERLGAGVMGAVWRAVDRKLGRPVAIKLLLPHKRGTRAQSRMIREARALARLVHPNVVAVYEVGLIEDEDPCRAPVYIVLEFVAGQTMDEWMVERRGRRRPGGWRAVVSMYQGAGEGLAAAHRAGLIHRDFKPANLLIDHGTGAVKVADFGLAAVGDLPESAGSTLGGGVDEEGSSSGLDHSRDHARLTRMGAVLGTPAYMAPEQLLGEPATAASDQFAFCLCLWEAVHGDRPWRHGSLEELRSAAARRSLSPGRPLERVPRWLDRALRRGLALEPEDRFPNMEALLRELDEGPRRPRRRWTAVALGASLAVVAGASSWWTAERAERTPNAPDLGACEAARSHLAESWNRLGRRRCSGPSRPSAGPRRGPRPRR
ncbi:serine/threonine kinase family protein [Plesiocystis pacifica SIR-1]|uniref:Serine/threonine kinase family protein n=1 Tax=Plesiocystis pacifica SIR-1 TaxID=391625 RepID=A6G848_9BACT|nr:serine/threonine-protein kinase [Plesiocystis pacifica]EDM78010.1 serine/threonine kinase family protein [Plesiocystis pacifica SIR-1]